jgi:hypothetical protein
VESVIGGKESFILKKSDLVIEFQQKNVDKFDRKRGNVPTFPILKGLLHFSLYSW